MEILLQHKLDIAPESRWYTISATAATKASLLFLQEVGDFICGPEYFTTREGFSSYLIKFSVSGCGTLEYQGQRYSVPRGHIFWIDCRKRQSYRTCADEGSWRTHWVHFYGANAQFYYDLFCKRNNGSPVAQLPADSPVEAILSQLLEQCAHDGSGNQQRNDLIYANLLGQLISECTLTTMSMDHTEDIPLNIQNVQNYLMQNFQQKITLEQLGSRFNQNPFYLQKQFKHYIGQSPTEYLIYLRMTHAKELIRTTHKSVSEVANLVGIDNLGYFTRLFKKHEGMPPHEYQKLWPTIWKGGAH